MSEFCYDCIVKYEKMPPDQNGLRHDNKNGLLFDVCEGCGEGYFNWQGKRQEYGDEVRRTLRPQSQP